LVNVGALKALQRSNITQGNADVSEGGPMPLGSGTEHGW